MVIKFDLHIHTVASGHAYSTVREIAMAAKALGLEMIGIADHGPAMPGGPHPYHFGNIKIIPREIEGIKILCGVEANVIDLDGNLDLDEEYLAGLDFVAAGFHVRTGYPGKSCRDHTRAMLAAMANPWVDWIVHPGNPQFQVDLEAVAAASQQTGVPLEINNTSLTLARLGSRENCQKLARLLGENGALVILGSDAHIADHVGRLAEAEALARQGGITPAQILNYDPAALLQLLDQHRQERKSKARSLT